jgi:hypothetical protein
VYPAVNILGFYFHLCRSVLRKVQEIARKNDYEADVNIRVVVRSMSTLGMVPPDNIAEAFDL